MKLAAAMKLWRGIYVVWNGITMDCVARYTWKMLMLLIGKSAVAELNEIYSIFTRGQFWPSGIVVGCVCLSVRLCVR